MRELAALAYGFLTAIICVQVMLTKSFRVGAEPLAACVLNFSGTALFCACFLLWREKGYRKILFFCAGGLAGGFGVGGFALVIKTSVLVTRFCVWFPRAGASLA